jgi:hypothetical protein
MNAYEELERAYLGGEISYREACGIAEEMGYGEER